MTIKLGVNPALTSTTKEFALGTRATSNGVDYIYVQASTVVTAYLACAVSEAFVLTPVTQTVAGVKPTALAVPQVTLSGTALVPVYGWAAVRGIAFRVSVDASSAASVPLRLGANTGSLTTVGTGSQVAGAFLSGIQATAGNPGINAFKDLAVN